MIDMFFLASAAAVAATGAMPLRLQVSTAAGKSMIQVVGDSATACTASYRLEVKDKTGSNHSVTGGRANLMPGIRQTLASVTLGPNSTAVATLDVQPADGAAYQQVWPARDR